MHVSITSRGSACASKKTSPDLCDHDSDKQQQCSVDETQLACYSDAMGNALWENVLVHSTAGQFMHLASDHRQSCMCPVGALVGGSSLQTSLPDACAYLLPSLDDPSVCKVLLPHHTPSGTGLSLHPASRVCPAAATASPLEYPVSQILPGDHRFVNS